MTEEIREEAWRSICDDLGFFWEDEEATVHELAHAYDCVGDLAFDYVGGQGRVNRLIADKYGNDDGYEANLAEIRTSAVTWRTLVALGLLTEILEDGIRSSLLTNLRGTWFETHTEAVTIEMFEAALDFETVNDHAKAIEAFLRQNWPEIGV